MEIPPPGPDLTHWEGEPVGVWESLWAIPHFEAWTELASTNDRARSLALAGALPFTTVVAAAQREGRGRLGATWQSARGAGLWCSLVVRPRVAAQAGLLPLLTGIAVARALEVDPGARAHGLRCGLKWPNDVWVGPVKVAGVLCEAVGGAVVVGVGVNFSVPTEGFAAGHAARAGALEEITGTHWSGGAVLGRLIGELRALTHPPQLRFEGTVAQMWSERDILWGRRVRVDEMDGWARGVGPDGGLIIEGADGQRRALRAGRVEWAGPPPADTD